VIPNRPSPPSDGVVPGGIVTDTHRVDTEGTAGRNRADEMVALSYNDQL
jgi:hypothetical protein